MSQPCQTPLSLSTLIAYERGELDPANEQRVEAHYFGCEPCSLRLEGVALLGRSITASVQRGAVSASVTEALLTRGANLGLRIRNYRVAQGAQVACTAAPDDDFVAIHLEVPDVRDAEIDVAVAWTALDTGLLEERLVQHLAFDHAEEQVVMLFPGDQVRAFPKSQWRMHVVVRDAEGERRIGPYTLNHTPWEQLAPTRS